MAIDYAVLSTLAARELTASLKRDGFEFVCQRGSHQRYRNAEGRSVTWHRMQAPDQNSEIDDPASGAMDGRGC